MLIEELGIMPSEVKESAWKSALITFGAFLVSGNAREYSPGLKFYIIGAIPMLPYLFGGHYSHIGKFSDIFIAAVVLFAVTLFTLGAFRVRLN